MRSKKFRTLLGLTALYDIIILWYNLKETSSWKYQIYIFFHRACTADEQSSLIFYHFFYNRASEITNHWFSLIFSHTNLFRELQVLATNDVRQNIFTNLSVDIIVSVKVQRVLGRVKNQQPWYVRPCVFFYWVKYL